MYYRNITDLFHTFNIMYTLLVSGFRLFSTKSDVEVFCSTIPNNGIPKSEIPKSNSEISDVELLDSPPETSYLVYVG